MKKMAILSVVLVLVLAGNAWAQPEPPATGPRFNYMGYVAKNDSSQCLADTLICVFNPNSVAVPLDIYIYLNDGTHVWGDLGSVEPMSTVCMTLGSALPPQLLCSDKFPFVLCFTRPTVTPWRGLVVEVKEIIYTGWVPFDAWQDPSLIRTWSETALNKGKGKYGGGVGYSN